MDIDPGSVEPVARYYYIDGVKQLSRWIDDLYYVDESGKMLTSTFTPDGYYVDVDGKWDRTIPRKK